MVKQARPALTREDQTMFRCPAMETLTVEGQPLELRCVRWGDDPAGRHAGDHLVHTPPAMGDDHTWANEDPLSAE